MVEPMFTVREVANILSLSESTIRNHLKNGSLEHIRLGNTPKAPIRIRESDLRKYLEGEG